MKNKIKSDKQIKSNAIRDNNGNLFVLQDGRARWNERKSYGVNFAKIFYMLGSEELKKAHENNSLRIDKKTGEILVDSETAKKYFLKSDRMSDCSSRLAYKIDVEGLKKLHNAYFCRERLCPICMWRLSRRLAWETNLIMAKYTAENSDMIPLLITLTVRNPRMGELSQMLDVLCNGDVGAWASFRKWLARRGIKDYVRTLEVTFNSKAQTWHPHLHILAFAPKDYFKKGNKNYISHETLKKEWQRICKLDYEPYVDIRRCYDKKAGTNERIDFDSDIKTVSFDGAIKETSKYCVKPLKLFDNSDDYYGDEIENKNKLNIKAVVRELAEALSGRRLRALGGKLKQIAKELKFDDDESKKDLLHKDETGTAEAIWQEIYEYVFGDKQYYLTAREEIAQENNIVDAHQPERHATKPNFAPSADAQLIRTTAERLECEPDGQLTDTAVGKLEKIFADGANIYSLKFEQGANNFRAVGVEGLAPASSMF